MTLLAVFGLPTWPLRVNVAVLRRLAQDGSPRDPTFVNRVVPALAQHPCHSSAGDRGSIPDERDEG